VVNQVGLWWYPYFGLLQAPNSGRLKHGKSGEHGRHGYGRPCPSSIPSALIKKKLDYIPKANPQGLFPIGPLPPEVDCQGPAIEVFKSSNQKSPLAHLITIPN